MILDISICKESIRRNEGQKLYTGMFVSTLVISGHGIVDEVLRTNSSCAFYSPLTCVDIVSAQRGETPISENRAETGDGEYKETRRLGN